MKGISSWILTRPFIWSVVLGVICCVFSVVVFVVNQLSSESSELLSVLGSLLFIAGLIFGMVGLVIGLGVKFETESLRTWISSEIQNGIVATGNEFDRKFQLSELARECEKNGLVKLEPDSSNFRYDQIIVEPQRLIVVLNDGRTWASQHRDRLRRRFEDPSKETTIFLTHPESIMIQVLAKKGSVDVPTLQARIRETVGILEELKISSTRLEILGHHLFNPFSLIIGDDEAAMTPYFLSRGGRTRPLFYFRRSGSHGYFDYLVHDAEMLRKDSEDISIKDDLPNDGVVRFKSR